MKRLILGKPFLALEGKLSHFPHACERIEFTQTKQHQSIPLHEAIRMITLPNDEFIGSGSGELPDEIWIQTPGDLQPTVLQLTREPPESYTIRESYDIVVSDIPFHFDKGTAQLVIEIGWCNAENTGVRIVTPQVAKLKLGKSPEAFSAGDLFDARPEKPIVYLLGGGGAVLLSSGERGEFINDSMFTSPYSTIAAIAAELTQILLDKSVQGIEAIEQWRVNRLSPRM